MYGFTIIHSKANDFSVNSQSQKSFPRADGYSYQFYFNTSNKFEQDKLFAENEQFIVGVDGVILNLKQLKNSYGISDYFQLLLKLYDQYSNQIASQFIGEFCGFLFDKKKEKLLFFNNPTGTKKVFYTQQESFFAIAPDLSILSKLKAQHGLYNQLDIDAAYSILTFGGMLENQTLITDCKKLCAGELLTAENSSIRQENYHSFNNVKPEIDEVDKACSLVEEVFTEAIKLEYEKDKEYGYKHLATLSGGLDSRMDVMLALEQGFSSIDTFCFSQSNYADETIAREISQDLNLPFKFIPLDSGEYVLNIDQNFSVYNGLIFYLSAAHFDFALKQLKLDDYGLIHTGQIGDAALGGGLLPKNLNKPQYFDPSSTKLAHKVKFVDTNKYASDEVYKLYRRQFNVTVSGSYTVESNNTYLVSPFLNLPFIEAYLSIHPKLRKNHRLYFQWIEKYHPNTAKYKWETTGFRPDAYWKKEFSRYTNKVKSIIHKFRSQKDRTSMNPYEYWFENNPEILSTYTQHIDRVQELIPNKELQEDILLLYREGNAIEQSMCITLLKACEKYQLKN